jgi:hypothetical protein
MTGRRCVRLAAVRVSQQGTTWGLRRAGAARGVGWHSLYGAVLGIRFGAERCRPRLPAGAPSVVPVSQSVQRRAATTEAPRHLVAKRAVATETRSGPPAGAAHDRAHQPTGNDEGLRRAGPARSADAPNAIPSRTTCRPGQPTPRAVPARRAARRRPPVVPPWQIQTAGRPPAPERPLRPRYPNWAKPTVLPAASRTESSRAP